MKFKSKNLREARLTIGQGEVDVTKSLKTQWPLRMMLSKRDSTLSIGTYVKKIVKTTMTLKRPMTSKTTMKKAINLHQLASMSLSSARKRCTAMSCWTKTTPKTTVKNMTTVELRIWLQTKILLLSVTCRTVKSILLMRAKMPWTEKIIKIIAAAEINGQVKEMVNRRNTSCKLVIHSIKQILRSIPL